MKLTKTEKIQFIYDFIGSLFCALVLGIVCAKFANPSSLNWEYYYFFLPVIFYLAFTYLFWKSSLLNNFRLNSLWIFINLTSFVATLFSVFTDRAVHEFLTSQSEIIPFNEFIYFCVGFLFLWSLFALLIIFFAFWFWYVGFIHRTVISKHNDSTVLNLKNL